MAKIHSRILKNTTQPRADPNHMRQEPKLLDVSITILSLTGFRAAESKNRQSMAKVLEQMRSDSDGILTHETKMVASFENGAKADTSKGVPMTHIPSLSFQLPRPFSHKSIFSDIVSWPEQAAENFWPEQAKQFKDMSSFQFQRKFVPEGGTNRLEPQVCPIQISASRNGKMYKLGVASVFVNGEERGESSITVSVAIDERMFNGSKQQQLDELNVPMVSLKGETMKCSLDRNASIRILVRVSDPNSTDFTQPVEHFTEDPVSSAVRIEYHPGQAVDERTKEVVTYDMFSGDNLARDRSKEEEKTLRSASTDTDSQRSDDEDEDWSLYSAGNSSIRKLKDQLRNGGFLFPSAAKQKLRSPTSLDDTATASLDDTTTSSSSTTASSLSEMVSSLRKSFPHSKSRIWANRLFACGVSVCGCRNNDDDELLSVVDENSILTDNYSLQSRE